MVSKPISLNPISIACAFGTIAFFLVLASTVGQIVTYMTGHDYIYGLVPLFYLDNENNIPTFFSSFLLIITSQLLLVITILEKKCTGRFVPHWAILSSGFLFMAIDESVCLHEKLVEPMRGLLGEGGLGIFYFAWVIPAIGLILVLALFFLKFLLHLNKKTRLTFLMAASIYLGGCIGFEFVGGRYAELHGMQNLTYSMFVTIEESLEIAGVIIFIYSLLIYITDKYENVQFQLHYTPRKCRQGIQDDTHK